MTSKVKRIFKTQNEARYGKIIHSGILRKRSKGKSWKIRFAVLWEDIALRFYETEKRGNVIGKIKIKHVDDIETVSQDASLAIDEECPFFFSIRSLTLKKQWQFGCDSHERLSEWVSILRSSMIITKPPATIPESDTTDTENRNGNRNRNRNKNRNKNEEQTNNQKKTYSSRDMRTTSFHGRNMSMEDYSLNVSLHTASSGGSMLSSANSLSGTAISNAFNPTMITNDNQNYTLNTVLNDPICETKALDDDLIEMEMEMNEEQIDGFGDFEDEKQPTQLITPSLLNQVSLGEKLEAENEKIVMKGYLERKTEQRIFGKHLWEKRYFKLSMHTLSIYQNQKALYPESVIKLSTIISVNRSNSSTASTSSTPKTKNRFNIYYQLQNKHKTDTIELRSATSDECQNWITCLTVEKRHHRQSIRSGLEGFALSQMKHRKAEKTRARQQRLVEIVSNTNTNASSSHSDSQSRSRSRSKSKSKSKSKSGQKSDRQKHLKKKKSKRFKRKRTLRGATQDSGQINLHASLTDDDDQAGLSDQYLYTSNDDEQDGREARRERHDHKRRLSIRSWAIGVERRQDSMSQSEISQFETYDPKKETRAGEPSVSSTTYDGTVRTKTKTKPKLTQPIQYEGFLIRKLGNAQNEIGEQLYFKLCDDTLEFSRVEQNLTSFSNQNRSSLEKIDILGLISVNHIKSVGFSNQTSKNEFLITFDDDPGNDWYLSAPKNNSYTTAKWVKILARARKEAKAVEKTIYYETEKGIGNDHPQTVNINNDTNSNTKISQYEYDNDNDNDNDNHNDGTNVNSKADYNRIKRAPSAMEGLKALARCIQEETIAELEMARMSMNVNEETANLQSFDIHNLQSQTETQNSRKYNCCFCFS